MVLLSELLSIALVLLTVFTALFYNVSHVVRKLARRHSVCAESIYSLPITYIATFVLLREESPASVAAIYLTVVTVNFSYMKLGRWSYKDWVLRIVSILLTISMYVVFFAFVGLGEVEGIARVAHISATNFDLKYYHVFGIFFSSWRFALINFILTLAIFPRRYNIVRVQISEKRKCTVRFWKIITLFGKMVAIWAILLATKQSPRMLESPWSDIDIVLLTDNDLLRITFGVVSMLMFFDIVSALSYSDDDKLYDWNDWMRSIKKKNLRWQNKFLGLLLAARDDHNNKNTENADIIGEQPDGLANADEENKNKKQSISNVVNNFKKNIITAVQAAASEPSASGAQVGSAREAQFGGRNVDIP